MLIRRNMLYLPPSMIISEIGSGVAIISGVIIAAIDGQVSSAGMVVAISGLITAIGGIVIGAGVPMLKLYVEERKQDRQAKFERHDLNNRLNFAVLRIDEMEDMVSQVKTQFSEINPPAEIADVVHKLQSTLDIIIESSDNAIVTTTADQTITSWNMGAQRMFGYRQSDMVGQKITKLLPELTVDNSIAIEVLKTGCTVHHKTTAMCADGTKVKVSYIASPIRDNAGKVIGVNKVIRKTGPVNSAQPDA